MDRDHIRYAEGQIPQDGWGGFDAYMKKKAAKLANQFESGASSCGKDDASTIFKGVSIFVNGYTDPPAEKLKRLMMLHGGRFIYYPTKANTTHIIATNLAYTKIKELKNEKVVTPNWITDSLKAGKLLPCAPYLLYRPKASNQTLHRFSADKKSPGKDQRHGRGSKDSRDSPVTGPARASGKSKPESDTHALAIHLTDVATFHPWNKAGANSIVSTGDNRSEVNAAERCDGSKDEKVVHPKDDASAKTASKLMGSDFLPSVEMDQKKTNNNDDKWKMTNHSENVNYSLVTVKKEPTVESCHSYKETGAMNESPKTGGFTSVSETVSDGVNEPSPKQKTEFQSGDDFSQGSLSSGKLYFPRSTDPNFLTSFYRHSSFYHLTTWRAEHKLFVKELQRKSERNGTFPGKEKLIARFGKNRKSVQKAVDETSKNAATVSDGSEEEGGTTKDSEWATDDEDRVIMHIDIDAFFVTVSLLNYPELRGKPVAVAHYAGKPSNKSLKHWKQKTLSEKEEGYKNHCQEFWAGGYKLGEGSQIVKGGSTTDGEDWKETASEVSSSQAVVQSESENFLSLAAIASCSYEARKAGVRNGMVMKTAKELCPELRTIPYNFEGYYVVSRRLYEIVASYTHDIQAASCDEVILDVTDLMNETGATGSEIAESMREEIYRKTQCTASAGLAPNVILAKLCTKAAKPDGVYCLTREGIPDFLEKAPVGDLPGIGRAFNKKLQSMGVYTCSDLQGVALKTLQKHFGPKTGQILYENCRGEDTRTPVYEKERKYVSVEVNYGIRFDTDDDAYKFLHRLSGEVHNKLKRLVMQGRTVSLKLKVRRAGTPIEDPKFMGYGIYDNKIRSISLNMETDNLDTIYRTCRSLLLQMAVSARDIRGVGIQMSRLKKGSSTSGRSKPLTEMLPKKEDCPKQAKVPTSPTLSSETAKKANTLLSFVTKNSPKNRRSTGSVSSMSSINSESNPGSTGNLSNISRGRDEHVKKKHFAPLEGIVLDQSCLIKRSQQSSVKKETMSPTYVREDFNMRRGELSSPDWPAEKKMEIKTGWKEERKEEKAWKQTKHVTEKLINFEAEDDKRIESVNQVCVSTVRNQTDREKQRSSMDASSIKEEVMNALNIATRDNAYRVTRDTPYHRAGDLSNRVAMASSGRTIKLIDNRVGWDKIKQGSRDDTKSASRDNTYKGVDTKTAPRDNAQKGLMHRTEKGPMDNANTGLKGNTKKGSTDDTNTGLKGNTKKGSTDDTNTGLKGNTKKRWMDNTSSYVKGNTKEGLMEKINNLALMSDTKTTPTVNKGLMSDTKKRLLDNMKKVPLGSTKKALLYNTKKRLMSYTKKGLMGNNNKVSVNSTKRMLLENVPQRAVGYVKKRPFDVNDRMSRRDNVGTAIKPKRPKVYKAKFNETSRTMDDNTLGVGSLGKTSRNTASIGVKAIKEKRYTVSEATKAKLWAFRRQDNKGERPNLTMVSIGKEGEETVKAPLMPLENEPPRKGSSSDELKKVAGKTGSIKRKGLPRPKRPKDVRSHAAPKRYPSAMNVEQEATRTEEDSKEVEETVEAPLMPPENEPSRTQSNSDELGEVVYKNGSIKKKGLPRPKRLQYEDVRSHAAPKRDPSATNVEQEATRTEEDSKEVEETVEAPLMPPENEPSRTQSNSDELGEVVYKNGSIKKKGLPRPKRLQYEDVRSHAAPKRDPSATNVEQEASRTEEDSKEVEETVEAPLMPPENEPSRTQSNSDELWEVLDKNGSIKKKGLPRPRRLQNEDVRSHAAPKRDPSATNVEQEGSRTEEDSKEVEETVEAPLMPPENEPSRTQSNSNELWEVLDKNGSIKKKGLPRPKRLQNEDVRSHAAPKGDPSATNGEREASRTEEDSKEVEETVEAPLMPPENEPSRTQSIPDELREAFSKNCSVKRKGLPRPKRSQHEDERSHAAPRTDPSATNVEREASRTERANSHGSGSSNGRSKHSGSKIDPSVLVSLPQEIQKEVIRDYKLDSNDLSDDVSIGRNAEKFDPNQASTSTGITSELDQEVLQNLPPDILQEVVANERSRLKLPQDEQGSSPRFTEKHTLKTACKRNIREALNIHETPSRKLSSFKIPKLDRSFKTGRKTEKETRGSACKSNESSTNRRHTSADDVNIHKDRKPRDVRSDKNATATNLGATNGEDVKMKVTEDVDPSEENQINLGGACKFVDVRDKLKQWTELFEKPIDEDISHVVHFMRCHILDQNLEMVFQLLRSFRRIVSSTRRRRWMDAYNTIKERVQTTVKHIYGGTLKLSDDLY